MSRRVHEQARAYKRTDGYWIACTCGWAFGASQSLVSSKEALDKHVTQENRR
jgi:hypothetical protein